LDTELVMRVQAFARTAATDDDASHMIVFLGGPSSVPAAVAFMAVHLALAAVVVALPAGKWVNRALKVPGSPTAAS
jgi:hypothetical protein